MPSLGYKKNNPKNKGLLSFVTKNKNKTLSMRRLFLKDSKQKSLYKNEENPFDLLIVDSKILL